MRQRRSVKGLLKDSEPSCCSRVWGALKPWQHGQGPQYGLISASSKAPLQRALAQYVLPVTLSTTFRTVILCVLVAMIVVSGVGISRLAEGYELSDLATDNHMLVKADKVKAIFRRNVGALVDAVLVLV